MNRRPPGRPAVFLDRDGTLNRAQVRDGRPFPPATLREFALYEGVAEACARLKAAGFALVVVTNQPDVGRGTQSEAVVAAMHAELRRLIPAIDRIEACFAPGQGLEHPENRRRKPAPGMLLDAATALGLDLARSWMVGDRAGDIGAGHAAGCRTILIDRGYAEPPPHRPPHASARSLPEAAGFILAAP
ncbi:MAG TPA: HAD-IIIA family hydrolase [Opitutaceae bacterium]|nr:HAD-IIIA family hydrolase [Opitutaceae bacterium]